MRFIRALALVGAAFVLLVQAASAHGMHPSTIIDAYERAWSGRDVDAALAQLADDAVINLQDSRTRNLTSRQQIREFLQSTRVGSVPMATSARTLDGTTLTWSERTDGQVMSSLDLTVQAVVENGKIQSLTYRPGKLAPSGGRATSSLAAESASMDLAGILLFGFGLLSLATTRPHVHSGSNLRGSLMRDLRHWRPRPELSQSQ